MWGPRGPFSDELADDAHECLCEPEISEYQINQRCERFIDRVNAMETEADRYDVTLSAVEWYELIAITAFISKQGFSGIDSVMERIHSVFGKLYSEHEIKAAFDVWTRYKNAYYEEEDI